MEKINIESEKKKLEARKQVLLQKKELMALELEVAQLESNLKKDKEKLNPSPVKKVLRGFGESIALSGKSAMRMGERLEQDDMGRLMGTGGSIYGQERPKQKKRKVQD